MPHGYQGKHRPGSGTTPGTGDPTPRSAMPPFDDGLGDLEFEPLPARRSADEARPEQPVTPPPSAPGRPRPPGAAPRLRPPRPSGPLRRARRGPAFPLLAGASAAVVVVALAAVAVPVLLRVAAPGTEPGRGRQGAAPAGGFVSVVPTDAAIAVPGLPSAVGLVKTDGLRPGVHSLTATRKGFVTLTATFTVAAGVPTRATFTLEPLPQSVSLTANPSKARISVTTADGKTLTRVGSLKGTLPAGPATITVTAAKHQTLTRRVFLDQATAMQLWMDPVGQVVHSLGAFRSVPAPKGVAVTPDGKQFWVTALVSKPSVEAYDVTGRVLGRVSMGGSGAVEVVFNRDGSKAYASQMQSASVFEIDTRTFKVLRQLKTGSSWTKMMAFSPDETKLYAANWSGDDISELDLASGKLLRRFPTVDTPRGVYPTADGTRLFIAGFGEQSLTGRLAVIDLATGRSRTFFTVKGGAMRHMVADEKRGLLYTSDMGKAVIWVTDMKTLKTTKWARTDSHPNTIDLTPDGKVLVVSCRGANNPKSYYIPGPEWGSVLLFDTETGKLLDAIIGGNQCTALDLSPDGRTLVFSDFLDARMHVYAIPDHATLKAGGGGRATSHLSDIRKPGWRSGRVSAGSGGD